MDALTLKPCVITHEGGPYECYMDKQQAHTHTHKLPLLFHVTTGKQILVQSEAEAGPLTHEKAAREESIVVHVGPWDQYTCFESVCMVCTIHYVSIQNKRKISFATDCP